MELNNITLLEVNCVDPMLGVKSLLYSSKDITFNRIILFSHIKPSNITDKIEFIQIPQLTYTGFSKFVLHELYKYIDTEFVLSINDDGFVINPHLWNPEFLNYDYIGAPWPGRVGTHRVGNGGFVLKSRRFLEWCKDIPYNDEHDDWLVSITMHDHFESLGCKFAPVELAMTFSLELPIEECEHNLNNTFGFHGKYRSDMHRFYNNMLKEWNPR